MLLIFHTSLLDIWRSERDCRLNIYSVGWTHYSVGCTLYSVGCICSVGCTHYSVGWAQCITDPSVANIYTVGCAQCSVSCKHILCRLYTALGSLTFSGKVLKNKLDKKLDDNNIRCLDRLRWVPSIATSLTRKPLMMPSKDDILCNKILPGEIWRRWQGCKNSTVQTTFDFLLPSPFDVSIRVEYNNTTTFTETPVDKLISN